MNNFVSPKPGDNVFVVCTNCGYRGSAKLARTFLFKITLKDKTCPCCKKETLIKDPAVMY